MLKTFFLRKVVVRQTVLSKSIDIISQEKFFLVMAPKYVFSSTVFLKGYRILCIKATIAI